MNAMITVILAVQMLSALAMIGLILVQHGKGADMGAAFGSGSSGGCIFCDHLNAGLLRQSACFLFKQRVGR